MANKIQLTTGMFILLVLTGGVTYFVAEGDTAYKCDDSNVVGICWKLSKVNAERLQTRCYYNESAPTRYKNCKTGWMEFKDEIVGDGSIISIGLDIELEQDKLLVLESLGINNSVISSCKRINEFECRAKIYQKNGIDNDFLISTKGNCTNSINITEKSCSEEFVYEEVCNEVTKTNCSWDPFFEFWKYSCFDFNETICSDQPEQDCNPYSEETCEYIQVENENYFDKVCTDIEIENCTNSMQEVCEDFKIGEECVDWNILTKEEINLEAIRLAEEKLEEIYQITLQRQNRNSGLLSDEITLNTKKLDWISKIFIWRILQWA